MGQENPRAHQTHNRRHRLNHRKLPLRPCTGQNDCFRAQSKRFSGWRRRSGPSDDLLQQVVGKRDRAGMKRPVNRRAYKATIDSPRKRAPHFRRVPVAISSRLGAEVGRIVNQARASLEVGVRAVEW